MNRIQLVGACFSLVFLCGGSAFGQPNVQARVAAQCLEDCQHQKTLQTLEAKLVEASSAGKSDSSCPVAGHKMQEGTQFLQGSLLSANGLIKQVNSGLDTAAQTLTADASHCGSCKETNIVSRASVSRPRQVGDETVCSAHPAQSLRGDFDSTEQAQSFAQATLNKNNDQGKKLYEVCPDPCSFYVYSTQTGLPGGKIRLNMVVRCGQPRGGIFAKYIFSGALVQEWTCKK